MKARETAMRLKRREVDDKTRKVEDLERIIREFEAEHRDDTRHSRRRDRVGSAALR